GTGGAAGASDWVSSMRGKGGAGAPGNLGLPGEPGQDGSVRRGIKFVGAVRPPLGDYSTFGNIYDDSGNPIARVTVELSGRDEFAVTDEDGSWTISELTNGEYTAAASGTGYDFIPQEFTVNGQDVEVVIHLKASSEDSYIDMCIAKFKDYFGSKVDAPFDCGNDNSFSCQMTSGGTAGSVTAIAVPKSGQGNFHYYWGGWRAMPLSYCD
ncbi:MAG: carboxypeptidase regulatory-like domain-containing protein, partial [Gammaproteobacteria bacterium]|nr:carboxypeptidase regulatory-like domain-containing protein [Gammaproteobacteria bacterium]